jgi:hypothetical protein
VPDVAVNYIGHFLFVPHPIRAGNRQTYMYQLSILCSRPIFFGQATSDLRVPAQHFLFAPHPIRAGNRQTYVYQLSIFCSCPIPSGQATGRPTCTSSAFSVRAPSHPGRQQADLRVPTQHFQEVPRGAVLRSVLSRYWSCSLSSSVRQLATAHLLCNYMTNRYRIVTKLGTNTCHWSLPYF